MVTLIWVVDLLLWCIFAFFIGYLFYLSIRAVGEYKKVLSGMRDYQLAGDRNYHRFAIAIPAHNEELTLPRTLSSLQAISYPKDYFDIFVIADNCTDTTASIAGKGHAHVLERFSETDKGKGYALRWFFDRMIKQQKSYDAILVLDADSQVFPNILDVMNRYLNEGAKVVQSYLAIEPKRGIWVSEITRLGYTLYNQVRSTGRRALDCPTGLKGNGMCLSVDILKQVPWQAYSLTEDLEYGLILLLNDVFVTFAPETVGYSTVPENTKNAESQRERWEIGRFPLVRLYWGKLLLRAINERSWKFFDAFIDLIMPPLVNMLLLIFIVGLLHLVIGFVYIRAFWIPGIAWFSLIGFGLLHMWIGIRAVKGDKALFKTVLYVPKYAIWKCYLYLNVFRRGKTADWVRTTRESSQQN